MLRFLTSYLLIAIVLICPQICLGGITGSTGTSCRAGGCCCTDHDDPSGEQTPQRSDESTPDCLCRGAIMDGVRMTELDSATPLAIGWLFDDAILSSIAHSWAVTSSEPPDRFPRLSTGRDICVLTCALLL